MYKEKGEEAFNPIKRGRPRKGKKLSELEQLRMENDILKKIQDLLEREKE
ncbi:MAG: hypothetical protein KQ78_00307 [Candidatus Izimaplasma bacterium HR2]|nr:MAG: hypothetical protein KQ78_00307 [Candidatus Izimaplasma bacterium HR2]